MSEKAPSTVINAELPSSLDYDQLDMRTYKNGANHVYGIDKDGKKRHISNDDVLEAYGYDAVDSVANVKLANDSTEANSASVETASLPDFKEGDIVKVPSMLKNEKGQIKEYRVVRIAESADKDGDRGVLLTSLDGKEDMSTMYSGVQKRIAEGAAKTDETKSTNTAESGNKGTLRSIEDGEFGDDYLHRSENSDPNDPDYLPVGVMAGEPWTFADKDGTPVKSGTTPGGTTPGTSLVPTGEKPNPGYDGPVESGSEIEHVPNSEIEHVPGTGIVPVPEADPRTRIGEAINTRMNELMENGMSEEDAHAQAHDEFWGGDVHENNVDEGGDDGEEDNGGSEIVQTIEVDPALIERLDQARNKYAELTAKSRKSYLGRFLQGTSRTGRLMRKIPGVATALANIDAGLTSMRGFNAETTVAKEAYEDAYNTLSEATAAELTRVGWEEDVVKSLSLIGNISQDKLLEEQILFERQKQTKDTNGFVNWWVSQKGFKGKLMKAGAVIAAGAATGLTAGIFAGAAGAFVAGGLAGGYIGKHVTKRRANGIDKETGLTMAVSQSRGDHAVKEDIITRRHMQEDWTGSADDIVSGTEASTDAEMLRNRKRVKTATALGAAAGKGAFRFSEFLQHRFGGHEATPDGPAKPKDPTTPKDPTPKPPKTPEVAPKPPTPEVPRPRFDVEPGSGFEREISQYFANNGKPISGSEAHKLYQSLEQTYGSNGLIKPSETYLRSGTDFGISRPGMYEVADGPAKVLSDWLAAK